MTSFRCFRVFTILAVGSFVLLNGNSASASVELGDDVGEITLIDARGKELAVTPTKERAAAAFLFLSGRSEAVDQSLEAISTLYRKHRRLGVVYIGVCSNNAESAEELAEYARDRGLIFTIYRDPTGTLSQKLDISTIPSVALVDGTGKLVHRGGLESRAGQLAFDAAVVNGIKPKFEGAVVTPSPLAPTEQKQKLHDKYGAISFSSELLFERIPGASVYHCSTITEAANADLLCLWYGGSYESADDQTLFLSRRPAGERTWGKPQALISGPDPLPGNGVIFVDGHERVWIIWCRMEYTRPLGRGQGWDNCRLMSRVSTDHGFTWSKDSEFLDAKLRAVPRNPPVRLASGDLVLPLEANVDGVAGSIFLIGADGGKQWRRGGFTNGGNQPAVIQRNDKSLFSMMRHAPRITQIESSDGGETWTKATPSALRCPDSGITMTRLANGHVVAVFNDSELARTPLSIVRSVDEGRTWETPFHLESNPGEYSYPCIIQTGDGKIHVTFTFRRYSIKHVELNEDWLIHTERPN
ncbi:exo-alpha-sialidase [Schlesneria sp.]|uniref:exo-alpha-sialidase n=1 Tax=Schlesneria sp. TaxID=2762018 RepID=UPI002F1F56F5